MEQDKRSAIFPEDNDAGDDVQPQGSQMNTKSGLLDTSSDDVDENGGFNLDDMGSVQNQNDQTTMFIDKQNQKSI